MNKILCLVSAGIIFGFGRMPALNAASMRVGWAPLSRGDYVTTARRIIPSAKHGDPRAQAMLGFLYGTGQGVPQSYDAAVDWYLQAADQGDATGQYLLGLMYDKGFGVTQNVVLAYKWLNLAAAHASPPNRENFMRLPDAVASKMNRAQLDLGSSSR
jgi:uncharacterized protein